MVTHQNAVLLFKCFCFSLYHRFDRIFLSFLWFILMNAQMSKQLQKKFLQIYELFRQDQSVSKKFPMQVVSRNILSNLWSSQPKFDHDYVYGSSKEILNKGWWRTSIDFLTGAQWYETFCSISLSPYRSKLECLSVTHFPPSLIFASKARAYPSRAS